MFRIIATLGGIQVATIAINVLRSKLLAVILGPEGVGVISVVDQSVLLIAQICAVGLPFAAVKFLSRSHSRGPEAFQQTYASLLRTLVILTSAGAVIGLLIVFLRPALLGGELSQYRALMIPAMLGIPAIMLHSFFVNVFAAAGRARVSAVLLFVIALLLVTAAVVGILVDGVTGFYWANLFANYMVVVLALITVRRNLGLTASNQDHSILKELKTNPEIVTFTLILFAASYTLTVSLFVTRFSVLNDGGEAEAGLLQAAIALAAAINLLLNPANGLYLTPLLNRDIHIHEKTKASLEFQRKLMLVMMAVAMPMVLFAPFLLILLFSSEFVAVSSLLFLFIIAQCVMQLAGVHQALMIGLDDLKAYAILVGAAQLSLGVVAWLLVPRFGLAGAAAGFVLSSLLAFSLTLIRLARKYDLTFSFRHLFLIGYGLMALFLAGIISTQLDGVTLWTISVKVVLLGLFLASLLLFLHRDEKGQLIALANKQPILQKWSNRGQVNN